MQYQILKMYAFFVTLKPIYRGKIEIRLGKARWRWRELLHTKKSALREKSSRLVDTAERFVTFIITNYINTCNQKISKFRYSESRPSDDENFISSS